MDMETGEKLLKIRDQETGELPAKPSRNQETGEAEIVSTQPNPAKRPFKIPTNYIMPPPKVNNKSRVATNILTRARVASNMRPVVLFLLPTIFCPIFAIFVGTIETLLHYWAHQKNKSLKYSDVYYQSPLHIIVSEFCSSCIDENTKNKITKMQDRNNSKFTKYSIECVKRIVS